MNLLCYQMLYFYFYYILVFSQLSNFPQLTIHQCTYRIFFSSCIFTSCVLLFQPLINFNTSFFLINAIIMKLLGLFLLTFNQLFSKPYILLYIQLWTMHKVILYKPSTYSYNIQSLFMFLHQNYTTGTIKFKI
jgi:hypothetical protein